MRSHRLWPVLAIAFAALTLGIVSTAALYVTTPVNRNGQASANGPYPTDPGAWARGVAGPGMMGPRMMGRYPATPPSCVTPALPGTVVDVTLTDMGGMMGPGRKGSYGAGQNGYQSPRMGMMGMLRVVPNPASIPAGQVSFRAFNTGWLNHELVVLPLAQGQLPGQRTIGSDGKVDETGSLGEASRTCGSDEGDEQSTNSGIAPGTTGWTTISLPPGRYELICNIAGHYQAGMYASLDVTGPAR